MTVDDYDRKLQRALSEFSNEADRLREAERKKQEEQAGRLELFRVFKTSVAVPTLQELSNVVTSGGHRLEVEDDKDTEVIATFIRASFDPNAKPEERKPNQIRFALDSSRSVIFWNSSWNTRGGNSSNDHGSIDRFPAKRDDVRVPAIEMIVKALGQ